MDQIKRKRVRKAAPSIERQLFDDCIDCLYEFDLGEELPRNWPPRVRVAIEAARNRIMGMTMAVRRRRS
jgi:hypothetical protein